MSIRLFLSEPMTAGWCGVLVTAGLATAQTITYERQSEGPLVGLPHAISVAPGTEDASGPVDEGQLKVRGTGFTGTAPLEVPPFSPIEPDYRISSILQGISPLPDIDAFSAGLDWVLTDGDGVPVVPPGNWTAMSFSVTETTLGDPDSKIREESGAPDGAAGDLFTYVYEGSALPPPLVGVVLRSQDSSEVSIGSVTAPRPDIDAHDLFVDLVWHLNPQVVPLLPAVLQTPRAFFSVTAATTGSVPTAWWAGSTPSGGTVFCSEWTGTSWTEPRPLVTAAELGLGHDEELDAVAVDVLRNEMLFSTKTALDPPVFWAKGFDHGPPGAGLGPFGVIVRVFRKVTGTPLPEEVGPLITDDVDAICALDPGGDPVLEGLIGTPDFAALPVGNTELSVSVFRTSDRITGQQTLESFGVGWPFPGRGPGLIAGFAAPINPSNYVPIMPVLPSVNRIPASPIGGDPHSVRLPLPQFVSGLGVPIFFYWVAADAGFQRFATSWPVRVGL